MFVNKEAVGKRILQIRKKYGYSMQKFGEIIDNAPKGSVNSWEKGVNLPNEKRLKQIATLGNMTLNELLYGSFKEYVDMLITDFLYDKVGQKHKKVMRYKRSMPVGKMFTWDDVKFGKSQYLLMHSVIYRTKVLRESGMVLPKHTFYVDNIYVFQPLPYVKNIYYLDVVLYKYFIGRDDQSVQQDIMIKRIDQQYRVTKIMLDVYNDSLVNNKNLDNVMVHYFDMMMCISSILSILEGSDERLKDKQKLWDDLKESNPVLYKKVRYSALGRTMNLKGKAGRKVSKAGYKIAQKLYGFN
jgi:transcriptional regulator with XRE-family HTH domain